MHWKDARKSERYWTKPFEVVPMRRQFLLTIRRWEKVLSSQKKGNKRKGTKWLHLLPFFWSSLRDIWDSLCNISPPTTTYDSKVILFFIFARNCLGCLFVICTRLPQVWRMLHSLMRESPHTWQPARGAKAPNLVRMEMLMLLNLSLQWFQF